MAGGEGGGFGCMSFKYALEDELNKLGSIWKDNLGNAFYVPML